MMLSSSAVSYPAHRSWRTALAIAAAAVLLCWPAFYNGYPLVYDDSASYLDTIDPAASNWARSIFYTAFLRPFHLHVWLWPTIFVQSAILAHLIYVAARCVSIRLTPGIYLLLMLPLALTMLPWLTSMIMPHAFTGALVLGMFLLGFAQDRLGPVERWYVALLTAAAATFHMSHLGLAAGLLIAILAMRLLLRWWGPLRLGPSAILAFPVVAAILAQVAVNSYARGSLSFAPASSIFLLARFVADGTATAYLRDACPDRGYILCAYLDQLPQDADEFLWPRDGVFRRAGGARVLQDEARAIVIGTLRTYPGRQLAHTADHVMRQLVDLRINSIMPATDPLSIPDYPIRIYIQGFFPGGYQDYLASRQSTGRLPIEMLNILHGSIAAASLIGGLLMMIAFIRRDDLVMVAFAFVIGTAWIGNAIITASVSGVFGHYQGRLAWVLTLYVVLGALHLARDRLPAQRQEAIRLQDRPQVSRG